MKIPIKAILALLIALPLTSMHAQNEKSSGKAAHKVVFEVVSEGKEAWDAVLNNVENARKALGAEATQIEVVAHGKGLGMLLQESPVRERLEKLAGDGVVFAACENTMRKKNVTKDKLSPKATTTDSGVAEVIRKQEAGWSYIKSGG